MAGSTHEYGCVNAFANGYIALGALQHLSVVARWSIVSVGSIVSLLLCKNLLPVFIS